MITREHAMTALPMGDGLAPGMAGVLPPPLTKLSEAMTLPMAAGTTN